jgi:hypothetical protein
MAKVKDLEVIADCMVGSSSKVGKGMHDLRIFLFYVYIVVRLIIFIMFILIYFFRTMLLFELFVCCESYVII